MKSKFFPRFVLIAISTMIILIVGTQLLEFKPNVSAAIAEFFFYAIILKFTTVYLDEKESENILYFITYLGVILIMVVIVSIIDVIIEKIFNINLEVEGMAAYTALILGYLLGTKFVKFFSKRLFGEKDDEEEDLNLGKDVEKDTAHIC